MTEPAPPTWWSDPTWLAEADEWAGAALAAVGRSVTGPRDQVRDMPWSTAIAYPTEGGRVWFKANGAGTTHEPGLVVRLGELVPGYPPQVVDVDPARGWSLTEDAGPILREALPKEEQVAVWEVELPRYAEVQLRLAGHAESLLAAGLPDRRVTPALLAGLLDDLSALPEDAGGLGPDRRRALERRYAAYDDWCAQLAASGIPDSIQHDDLHSGNVCVAAAGEPARVIDWGDASLTHPFTTMVATLNSLAFHHEVDVEDPLVTRLRDAYLEAFADFGSHAELVGLVAVARQAGAVVRALSWQAALTGVRAADQARWEFPVRAWLEED